MKDEINYVDVSGTDKTFLVLSSDKALLMSTRNEGMHVVNILPSLDPYMMGFKDRERCLDSERYKYVFDRSGNATSTILLDGRVIGVWNFEDPFAKVFLFDDNETDVLKEIHFKARSVGTFITDKEVRIKECDSMIPLTQRTAGGVMSPLKDC